MSSQDYLIAGGGAVLALAALSWLTGSLTLGFALTCALAVTMIVTMLLGSLLVKSAPESAAVASRSKRVLSPSAGLGIGLELLFPNERLLLASAPLWLRLHVGGRDCRGRTAAANAPLPDRDATLAALANRGILALSEEILHKHETA